MKTLIRQERCSIAVGETFIIGDRENCSVYIRIPDEQGKQVLPGNNKEYLWCVSTHSGTIYMLPKTKATKVKPIEVDCGVIIFVR